MNSKKPWLSPQESALTITWSNTAASDEKQGFGNQCLRTLVEKVQKDESAFGVCL